MAHMAKEVTIYSTPVCHFCQAAKEYFNDNGVCNSHVVRKRDCGTCKTRLRRNPCDGNRSNRRYGCDTVRVVTPFVRVTVCRVCPLLIADPCE